MPSRLQKLPIPSFSFMSEPYSPPSEWSPSPVGDGSQTFSVSPSDHEISLDLSSPSCSPGSHLQTVPRESHCGQNAEVHVTEAQKNGYPASYAPPNSAPLLDSRVYVFYTSSSGSEEFDFSCMGHNRRSRREPMPNEGRTLGSGRARAWSSPGRPQSALSHTQSPRGSMQIISGPIMGREKKSLTRGSPEPTRANGNTGLKRLALEQRAITVSRNGAGVRVSNKWGEHPPAGYF